MSNAARKARKKAHVKFERTPKTPTPLHEISVPRSGSTKRVGLPSRRALARLAERANVLVREGAWGRRVKASDVNA